MNAQLKIQLFKSSDSKILHVIKILPVSLSTEELYSAPSARLESRCDTDDGMSTARDLSITMSHDASVSATMSEESTSGRSVSFLVVISSSSATSTNSRLHIYTSSQTPPSCFKGERGVSSAQLPISRACCCCHSEPIRQMPQRDEKFHQEFTIPEHI